MAVSAQVDSKAKVRRMPLRREVEAEKVTKGMLAGAAGGLFGAWAMIRFAGLWSSISGSEHSRLGTEEELDAASNVVDIFTRKVLHVRLKRPQKQRVAAGFHYVFGTILGAAYGALAEYEPLATTAAGAPFGAVEWLMGNKLTAPRFGLVKPRDKYPKAERVQTFAAHVVYGVAAELVRRSVRSEL